MQPGALPQALPCALCCQPGSWGLSLLEQVCWLLCAVVEQRWTVLAAHGLAAGFLTGLARWWWRPGPCDSAVSTSLRDLLQHTVFVLSRHCFARSRWSKAATASSNPSYSVCRIRCRIRWRWKLGQALYGTPVSGVAATPSAEESFDHQAVQLLQHCHLSM